MSRNSLSRLKSSAGLTMDNWRRFSCHAIPVTQTEFEHFLGFYDALWFDERVPREGETIAEPHALLTSGLHSNGFINLGRVLKDHDPFCWLMAQDLANLYTNGGYSAPDCIVGADTSSTKLAGYAATLMGARHLVMIKQPDKSQLWMPGQRPLGVTEVVAGFEELMTSGGSTEEVCAGVQAGNPEIDVVFSDRRVTIVVRSDPDGPSILIYGSPPASIYRYPIHNWEPDKCPWCKYGGSEAIPPKAEGNWARLIGKA